MPVLARRAAAAGLLGAALVATRVDAADFSGSVAVTTDYVFRGVSQTQGDPALQLGLKLAFEPGVYVSSWASNVDYGSAVGSDAEVDYVVGWAGELSPTWALDVNLTRYTYPGTNDDLDLDYNELVGTLTWDGRWFGVLGYSNDVFATGESGTYVQLGARLPLSDTWTLEGSIAHYALGSTYADDYQHATLSAVYTRGPLALRFNGHVPGDSAEDLFGDVGEPRIEISATYSF
jgi:uncharacterized protein (TIGR02001 family)